MKRRIVIFDNYHRIVDSLAHWRTHHGHDVRTATDRFRAIKVIITWVVLCMAVLAWGYLLSWVE